MQKGIDEKGKDSLKPVCNRCLKAHHNEYVSELVIDFF